MKKQVLICLLIVLLAIFAACADDNWEPPNSRDGYFSIRSIEEYQEFFEHFSPPDDYVLYDDLEELGHLDSANISAFRGKPVSRHSYYSFVDETGFEYSLYIDKKPVQEYDTGLPKTTYITLDSPDNTEDLRGLESEDRYEYWIGDIMYKYAWGQLLSVEWETKTNQFTVCLSCTDNDIREYDLNADTFVAKLLRESTAEKAIEKLNTRVTLSLVWRKFCRYWLPWILVVVVSCATIGTVYLILRRRKNKNTAPAE